MSTEEISFGRRDCLAERPVQAVLLLCPTDTSILGPRQEPQVTLPLRTTRVATRLATMVMSRNGENYYFDFQVANIRIRIKQLRTILGTLETQGTVLGKQECSNVTRMRN